MSQAIAPKPFSQIPNCGTTAQATSVAETLTELQTSANKSDSTYRKCEKAEKSSDTTLIRKVHSHEQVFVNISSGVLSIMNQKEQVIASCRCDSNCRIREVVATDRGDYIFVTQEGSHTQEVYFHDRFGGLTSLLPMVSNPILTEDRIISWDCDNTGGFFCVYYLNGKRLAHREIRSFSWTLHYSNKQIILRNTDSCSQDWVFSKDGLRLNIP